MPKWQGKWVSSLRREPGRYRGSAHELRASRRRFSVTAAHDATVWNASDPVDCLLAPVGEDSVSACDSSASRTRRASAAPSDRSDAVESEPRLDHGPTTPRTAPDAIEIFGAARPSTRVEIFESEPARPAEPTTRPTPSGNEILQSEPPLSAAEPTMRTASAGSEIFVSEPPPPPAAAPEPTALPARNGCTVFESESLPGEPPSQASPTSGSLDPQLAGPADHQSSPEQTGHRKPATLAAPSLGHGQLIATRLTASCSFGDVAPSETDTPTLSSFGSASALGGGFSFDTSTSAAAFTFAASAPPADTQATQTDVQSPGGGYEVETPAIARLSQASDSQPQGLLTQGTTGLRTSLAAGSGACFPRRHSPSH